LLKIRDDEEEDIITGIVEISGTIREYLKVYILINWKI
jgi:hypothetical protein